MMHIHVAMAATCEKYVIVMCNDILTSYPKLKINEKNRNEKNK